MLLTDTDDTGQVFFTQSWAVTLRGILTQSRNFHISPQKGVLEDPATKKCGWAFIV